MNAKTKRRMVVVTGVIVIVLVIILAVVGGSSSAKSVTVADTASGGYAGQKIQVTGTVVDNSYETDDDGVLTFAIYDADGDASEQLNVRYPGGVSATFGNGVTAICTGKIDEGGVLNASELVTKCPSKYENSADALGVAQLVGYGADVVDKPVKVTGVVKAGTLSAAGAGDRFVLADAESGEELSVAFDGALSEDVQDGSSLVLTGSIGADGTFAATDVALEG